jgi:hypothetical protein
MDTTATLNIKDGVQTATFKIAAEEKNLTAIMNDASAYLFEKGYGNHGTTEEPITFDSLKDEEKVAIVDEHLKRVVLDMANAFKSEIAQKTAREQVETEKYSL